MSTAVLDRPADPIEPVPAPAADIPADPQVKPKDILIINYSGDLEKVWATMILATASAAMGI